MRKPLLVMNRKLPLILTVYGTALAGISFLNSTMTSTTDPWIWRILMIAGALCIGWAVLDKFGWRRRVGPVLTLVPVILILIGQITGGLVGIDEGRPPVLVTALNAVMLAGSVAVVGCLVYAAQNPSPRMAQV